MADFAKVNNVAAADIAKVNNVAKAAIANISGATTPSSGATLWTIVGADGAVSTAAAADLNDWTGYVSSTDMASGGDDYNSVAYGKDGNGASLWVAVNDDNDREIRYSSDPTGTSGWSDIAGTANDMLGVAWGNNVWIAVGENGELWRSTAGTTGWAEIDLSGVTGWQNDKKIWEVVSDGAGKWMFAQDQGVFLSTNDGAAWSRVIDFTTWSGTDISGYTAFSMAYSYTSSRWLVYLSKGGNTRVYYAAAADTAAWAGATVGGSAQTGSNLIQPGARRMASGANTVIIVDTRSTSRSTNGGVDWTKNLNDLPRMGVDDIATDGNGNWIAVHGGGFVSVSTNDGDSWAEQTGVQDGGSGTQMTFPTGGSNVEALDAGALILLTWLESKRSS